MDNFHTFEFNGKKLSELGAVIAQRPKIVIATHDIKLTEIPFLSGDIVTDGKRYKNISYKYNIRAVPTYCNMTVDEFSKRLAEWLDTGTYSIYRDTYNAGYFRYAIVTKIDTIEAVFKDVYETSITFSFAPFMYSDDGIKKINLSSANNSVTYALTNPEQWESLPVIKITGSGNFTATINGVQMTLTGVNNYIVIDKPNEDVYDGGGSCNNKISALKLPSFSPGQNSVVISSNNSFSVEITPNWRRL